MRGSMGYCIAQIQPRSIHVRRGVTLLKQLSRPDS